MRLEVGHVEAIFRYPVKSMGGERLEVANLGWHGLEGDRRLAFRRVDDRGGFPWLSATKLPDLLLFAPHRREDNAQGDLLTHIRTPDGDDMPVFGEDLAAEVGRRYGAPVQTMQLKHGIFDEATISVIALDTVHEVARLAGRSPDVRRFRPNVVVRPFRAAPFQEDEWLGGVLSFGEGDDAPAITVTMHDVRCSMLNLLSSDHGLTASSFMNKAVLPDTSVDGPALSAGEFGLDPFLAWTAGFVNFWEIGSGRKHVYDDTPPPGSTRPVGSDTSNVAPTLATLSRRRRAGHGPARTAPTVSTFRPTRTCRAFTMTASGSHPNRLNGCPTVSRRSPGRRRSRSRATSAASGRQRAPAA